MYVVVHGDPLIDTSAGGRLHHLVLLTEDEIEKLQFLLHAVRYRQRDVTPDEEREAARAASLGTDPKESEV